MGLIVQKFGGSSVADADRIRNVARIITETYRRGHKVVAVLSAQGDTTDDLIAKAAEINPNASKREMDMLLSTGEQISCSLCAMAIEAMGYPVISLTGWQAGFRTNSAYGDARIKRVDVERVLTELDKNTIVIVTGFQGINKYDDITTLGRGGSDTSAVALAAVLQADLCQICALQLFRQARHQSQGGCENHGKTACQRRCLRQERGPAGRGGPARRARHRLQDLLPHG